MIDHEAECLKRNCVNLSIFTNGREERANTLAFWKGQKIDRRSDHSASPLCDTSLSEIRGFAKEMIVLSGRADQLATLVFMHVVDGIKQEAVVRIPGNAGSSEIGEIVDAMLATIEQQRASK